MMIGQKPMLTVGCWKNKNKGGKKRQKRKLSSNREITKETTAESGAQSLTCKHHGGKGLVSRQLHFTRCHSAEFNHDYPFFEDIKKALKEDDVGKFPCVSCKKLVGCINNQDLCLICCPTEEKNEVLLTDGSEEEQKSWALELEKLNRKHLTTHKGYPPRTAQRFSLALDYCHQAELNAKTDRELWKAKIKLAKLKAVWIVDVRGSVKNGRTWIEKVKRSCNLVLIGKVDEVW